MAKAGLAFEEAANELEGLHVAVARVLVVCGEDRGGVSDLAAHNFGIYPATPRASR